MPKDKRNSSFEETVLASSYGHAADTVSDSGDTLGSDNTRVIEPPIAFKPGDEVGHFTVVSTLGRGGMGVVVSAYDARLNRKVAIKVLRPDVYGSGGSSQGKKRLVREAQAMAQLSHPNVVSVYEVGTIDGQVFVAMEYVDGQTLTAWIQEKPRTWREIVNVFISAGRGLAAAHEAGLVHRDFKPDNVLVGKDGRVRVTDFGLVSSAGVAMPVDNDANESALAKLDDPSLLSVTLTRTGMLLGTPIFMAPEQHNREPVDAAADQFSFCVSLYWALYGTRPYSGKTYWQLAKNVTFGHRAEPPADSDVPDWVRNIVFRGLSSKPADRYPTMQALLSKLGADPEATRRARRRVMGVWAAIIALAGIALFGLLRSTAPRRQACSDAPKELVGVWDDSVKAKVKAAFLATGRLYAKDTFERVEKRFNQYSAEWTETHRETCEANLSGKQSDTLLDLRMHCLRRRLSELRAQTRVLGENSGDVVVLDKAVPAALSMTPVSACSDIEALSSAIPPPEHPDVRARVEAQQLRLDDVTALRKAGKYKEALVIANAVADATNEIDHAPLRAMALYQRGVLEEKTGEWKTAEVTVMQAFQVASKAGDDALVAQARLEHFWILNKQARYDEALALVPWIEAAIARAGDKQPFLTKLLSQVGVVLDRQGKYDEARGYFERSLAIKQETLGSNHPEVASPLNSLGIVWMNQGKYDKAREYYERSLAIKKEALGGHHPDVAKTLYNLGLVLHHQGKFDEARSLHESALAIRENALGPDHPNVASSLNELGGVLMNQGKYDEARPHYERSLAIWKKKAGPDHPRTADALASLGQLFKRQGKFKEARSFHERALAIRKKALGEEHPRVARSLKQLGVVVMNQGKYDEAREYYERALAIWKEALGPDHPSVADSLDSLGRVLKLQGKYGEARSFHERALALREKTLGPDHPNVAVALENLSLVLEKLGKYDKARTYLERSLAILEKHFGPDHPEVAISLFNLGNLLAEQDKSHPRGAKAIGILERAAKILQTNRGYSSALAETHFVLARVLWNSGRDRKRAIDLAKAARHTFAKAESAGKLLSDVTTWLDKRAGK